MKKKVLSLLMTAALVVAMACPVMADTGTWSGRDSENHGGTFTSGAGTDTSTGTTKVTATIDSSYSVVVPATLRLTNTSGDTYEGTYMVGVRGNIATNKKVTLAPTSDASGNEFTMTSTTNASDTADGDVDQSITEWVKGGTLGAGQKEINIHDGEDRRAAAEGTIGAGTNYLGYSITTGTATVDLTSAGTYNGTVTFEFALGDRS